MGSGLAHYFDLAPWLGFVSAWAIAQFFGGGAFALFAVLAGDARRQPAVVAALRAGSAFAAGELLRSKLLTGAPWLLLGHALAPVPELAQLASIGGTALLSFWLATWSACLVGFRMPRQRLGVSLLCGALALGQGLAWCMAPGADAADARVVRTGAPRLDGSVRVALVQSAIPNAWRRDPRRLPEAVDRLVEISRTASSFDLLVWPENAFHALLPANRDLVRSVAARALSTRAHLLFGAPRSASRELFTSALLVDARGDLIEVHDKVQLLPFTEYVPAPFRALGWRGPGFSAGKRSSVLRFHEVSVGPLICYELLFAELARALVRDGAGVLVNIANDSWFARSGGAEQHLSAAVLRAIELRRPLLRSTTSGATVAIDSAGRTAGRLPLDAPGVLLVDVWPAAALSAYARTGDLFGWAALIAALALGGLDLAIRRS